MANFKAMALWQDSYFHVQMQNPFEAEYIQFKNAPNPKYH